jgi:superfamily I DNA/RNA helicase
MYPAQQFLVTCYTRSLASQLRLLLADYENIEVTHLNRLMDNAIRSAKLPAPTYEQDPGGDARAEVAVKALERGALTRYRAVFVDEAQDFGTNALIFARSLVDTRHDDLLVVADAAQNIFRRKFSWNQAGINAQGRTRILRVNYRNTREVLELASGFLLASETLRADENPDLEDEDSVVPPRSAARTGPEAAVTLTKIGDLIRAAISATESFVDAKAAPRKVALLYLGTREGREIAKALDAAGVEYFWASDPVAKGNRDRIAETLAPVVLSTVRSAKGLEFRSVVLSCTPREVEQDLDELRMTIYVGMTRATEQLAVFAHESHPLAGDLRAAAEAKGRLIVGMQDE